MKWFYSAKRQAQLLHCVNKTSYNVTNYTVEISGVFRISKRGQTFDRWPLVLTQRGVSKNFPMVIKQFLAKGGHVQCPLLNTPLVAIA